MKKQGIIFAIILLVVMAACDKNEDENQPEENTPNFDITELNNGITTGEYAPYTTGSTFDYKYIDMVGTESFSTWTVLEEKTINDKIYIEIEGFLGASDNGYFNCENGDYTVYMPDTPLTPSINMIYMKEDVPSGTEWEESINMEVQGIQIENKYIYSYVENLESWVVEDITYNDVLHIHLKTYTIYLGIEQLASEDDFYWGKGVGLLEKSGDLTGEIRLLSYDIQ